MNSSIQLEYSKDGCGNTQFQSILVQPPVQASLVYFLYAQRAHHPDVSCCPPSCFPREDEHALIQQYCQTLGGESPVSQPQSPAQILKSVEKEERGELERIIADLEEEQR